MKKKQRKKRHLKIENLEPRILWNAVPAADLQLPDTAPAGEQIEFEVKLENQSDGEAGRNPFVDVHLDADMTFDSAALEGTNVNGQSVVFDGNGQATHPITGELITGTAGDTLIAFDLKNINESFAAGESARLSVFANIDNGLALEDQINVSASFGFDDDTANDGVIEARSALNTESIEVQDFSLFTKLSQEEFEIGDTGTVTTNVVMSAEAGEFSSLQIKQVIPDGVSVDPNDINAGILQFDGGITAIIANVQVIQENGQDVVFIDLTDVENNPAQNTDAIDIVISYNFDVAGNIGDVNNFATSLEADQVLLFDKFIVGNDDSATITEAGVGRVEFSNELFDADVTLASNSGNTVLERAVDFQGFDFEGQEIFERSLHFRVGTENGLEGEVDPDIPGNDNEFFGIATATFDFIDPNNNDATIALENLKASFLDLDGFGNEANAEVIRIQGFLNGVEVDPQLVFLGDLLEQIDDSTFRSTDGAFVDFNPDVNVELFFTEVDQIVFTFKTDQTQISRDSFVGNFKRQVLDVNSETSFTTVGRDLQLEKELLVVDINGVEADATDVANNPVDAGDLLRIRNTIQHVAGQSNTVALIDNFSDIIPDNTTIEGDITIRDDEGNILATVDPTDANLVTFNGNEFTLNFDQIDSNLREVGVDQVVIIEYDVRIEDTVEVQEDLQTTATLVHDGNAPEQASEQTEVSTRLEVTTNLTDENDQAITEAQLGDIIRINTDVDMTEGTYPDLVITQVLPEGVVPDLNNITINGIVEEGQNAPDVTAVFDANNNRVTFTFNGNHVVGGEDGFSANGEIEIIYDTVVDDVTDLIAQGVNNRFSFNITTDANFTDFNAVVVNAVQDQDPIDILLPQLNLNEEILLGNNVIIDDANGDAQDQNDINEQVDAGDTLTVRSTVSHDAASLGASNVETFANVIPTGTSLASDVTLTIRDDNGNVLQNISVAAADAVVNGDISIDLEAQGLDQLGTNDTLTVEYDLLVEDVVQANQELDTDAAVTADGVDLDDTNKVTITPLLEIETTLTPQSDPLSIGDSVEINNVINATEGTASNLVVTQVLPEGLIPDGFDENGNLVDATEFTFTGIADTNGNAIAANDAANVTITFNAANGTLTFTFLNDVVFAAEDGFSPNNEATIVYNATLDNVDVIVDGNETVETTIEQDDNNDQPLDDDDTDNLTIGIPVLVVDQVVNDAGGAQIADNQGVVDNNQQIDAGDTLTIVNTISHDNASTSASNLENFTDDLPNEDLVVVNNSVTIQLLDVNGAVVETVNVAAADAVDVNGDIDLDLANELNRSVLDQG
ncbi:hypothetical protein, partial [Candidatus Uabimicrobium amorphum]